MKSTLRYLVICGVRCSARLFIKRWISRLVCPPFLFRFTCFLFTHLNIPLISCTEWLDRLARANIGSVSMRAVRGHSERSLFSGCFSAYFKTLVSLTIMMMRLWLLSFCGKLLVFPYKRRKTEKAETLPCNAHKPFLCCAASRKFRQKPVNWKSVLVRQFDHLHFYVNPSRWCAGK